MHLRETLEENFFRHKARFVGEGFKEKLTEDYDQTLLLTVKMITLRILLSSAVQEEMKLKQLGKKTAYFIAGKEEEIFVDQPPGFVKNKPRTAKDCAVSMAQKVQNFQNMVTTFFL